MQIAYPSSFAASLHCRTVAVALMAATCIAKNAIAQSCLEIGLVPGTANVLVLSQASHADRSTLAYRDFMKTAWFLPLRGDILAGTPCVYENVRFWKISAADAALNHDPDTDLLTYLDMRIATNIIDARKAPPSVSAGTIDSLVINCQPTAALGDLIHLPQQMSTVIQKAGTSIQAWHGMATAELHVTRATPCGNRLTAVPSCGWVIQSHSPQR